MTPDTASQIYDICDDLDHLARGNPIVAQAILRLRSVARHVRPMERHCNEAVAVGWAAQRARGSDNVLHIVAF